MTTGNSAGTTHDSFSNSFLCAFLRALTDASGSPWEKIDSPGIELPPDEGESVRVRLALDGSLRGELLLEFRRTEAAILAAKFLQAPVVEFGEEQSQALVNLVATGAIAFRSELGQEYGAFNINASLAPGAVHDRTNLVQITSADDGGNRMSVWMFTDSSLMEWLALRSQAQSVSADAAKSIKAATGKEMSEQVNLDLVMDVELNVTLRFGQRQLTLREVLELTSGSVVELDRQVDEPVELLLDGVVIARGEAVVIDGNYGLRVTEVSQPLSSAVLV
jgi:flagellar motor switch protein FliN/FliY